MGIGKSKSMGILKEIRIGKRAHLGLSGLISAIDKLQVPDAVEVNNCSIEGDEYGAPELHGGPEQAILHYPVQHYNYWRKEYPNREALMVPGGFGENFVVDGYSEENVCIGDIFEVGSVKLQVSMPRQPCIRLNHRFDIAGMAQAVQRSGRTGWYYRVLTAGRIMPRLLLRLIERPCPEWTIAKVQHLLYTDLENFADFQRLAELEELAPLMRKLFANRVSSARREDWGSRLGNIETRDPSQWLTCRVEALVDYTPKIKGVLLSVQDGGEPPAADAGAHIKVRLPNNLMRQYSLCPTDDRNRYRIAIALNGQSRGGSTWFHKHLAVGGILSCSLPVSSFPVALHAKTHVMFAGGIGITPFLSMIDQFERTGQDYELYYMGRQRATMAFLQELETKCGDRLATFAADEHAGQRLDIVGVISNLDWDTHVYCCGPQSMIDAVLSTRAFFPSQNIHVEKFDAPTSAINRRNYSVRLANSSRSIEVDTDSSLLLSLRANGVSIPSSCETGSCGSCVIGYSEGEIEHRDSCLSNSARLGFFAPCVSHAISQQVTILA